MSEYTINEKLLRVNTTVEWLPGGAVRVTERASDGTSGVSEYTAEEAKALGLWATISPFNPEEFKEPSEKGNFAITKIDKESRTVTLEPSK